jgi:hypothetical protein
MLVYCGALLFWSVASSDSLASSKKPKPTPAAEYVGHVVSAGGLPFTVHIDSFTPDDAAEAVVIAGHDGNPNAIRSALGHLDAGFMRVDTWTYRIAYARRQVGPDGSRIILVFRNELESGGGARSQDPLIPPFIPQGRTNGKELGIPPLAAAVLLVPNSGMGEGRISTAATVVFRSADEVEIKDWSGGWDRVLGVRERTH